MNTPELGGSKKIADLTRQLERLNQELARKAGLEREIQEVTRRLAEAKKLKSFHDLNTLVRRWYLRIVLGLDLGDIKQIMDDTLSKKVAIEAYKHARKVHETLRELRNNSPSSLPSHPPLASASDMLSRASTPKENAFIASFESMEDATRSRMSQFFQWEIDLLEERWSASWQQRIDSIIARWNQQNPGMKIYKYTPGLGHELRAWQKWKESYDIHCQADFAQKLWVTFPNWMIKKTRRKKAKRQASSTISIHSQESGSASWYISTINQLDSNIRTKLRQFFQSAIDSLENKWTSTWQQRIDPIITNWNRENPKLRLYKYQPWSSDMFPAWERWRTFYLIKNQEDFSEKFWVTFPPWLKARKRNYKKSRTIFIEAEEVSTRTPVEQSAIRVASPTWESQAPNSPSNAVSERLAKLASEYLPMLRWALNTALQKYKKAKTVQWNPDDFIFHISKLQLSTPRERALKVELWTLPEEQKWFWKALITQTGINLLGKAIRKIPHYTFAFDSQSRTINIQTWAGVNIEIIIPSEEDLKITSKNNEDRTKDIETEHIALLKSGFSLQLTEYLEWFYEIHYKEARIEKDVFTNHGDISYKILSSDDGAGKKISGNIKGQSHWIEATYQALQNVDNLRHYFEEVMNGTGIHIEIDKNQKESVTFVYTDQSIPWMELEFRPY